MPFLPQTLVDWAQITSAIGTCGAVIVSLVLSNRGVQTKLDASCVVSRGIGAPRLKVLIRNVGRDTVYLVAIGGSARDGTESSERFTSEQSHLTILPGEPNTVFLERHLTATRPQEGLPKQWTRMWIKDVSGKRFYVKQSAECLAEAWGEMRNEPPRQIAGRDFPS